MRSLYALLDRGDNLSHEGLLYLEKLEGGSTITLMKKEGIKEALRFRLFFVGSHLIRVTSTRILLDTGEPDPLSDTQIPTLTFSRDRGEDDTAFFIRVLRSLDEKF